MTSLRSAWKGLREKPIYALMRGAARSSAVRSIVVLARNLAHSFRYREFLAHCRSSVRKNMLPYLDVGLFGVLSEYRHGHVHFVRRYVGDFGFMKFFLYLTDVVPIYGGHVCGATSRCRRLMLRLQFSLFDCGVMHDRRESTSLGPVA